MFGLTVSSGLPLPGLVAADDTDPEPAPASVTLDLIERSELVRRFSGATNERGTLAQGDGETIEVTLGRREDVLLAYGQHALFLVAPGGAAVFCAAAAPAAFAWQRVLLDTVLGTAALCGGLEALHAAAVELPEGVVAITGPSGGGKSTLCAELIHRGARLFADDMVFLTRDSERILAHPGPPLMNVALDSHLDTERLGDRLAVLGGEEWVVVRDGARAPRPLRAVVVLDRRPDAHGARLEAEASPLAIIGAALDSGPWSERRRARFELLADLVRDTPVLRLLAGTDVPPAALAELAGSATRQTVRS
jgi:hypothetical protein